MKGCRVLTENEIQNVLGQLDIRDKVLMLTGLTFGARISEALELTFGDLQGDYLYLKSKKKSENTAFPIPRSYKQVMEELRKHYEGQGIEVTSRTNLFLSRKGKNQAITRQQASQTIKGVCKELGITGKVNSHSFRKSFVTKIYELTGKDIAQTKVYSRHKNLANLDYYINTTKETSLINQFAWV